ncbi:hypothetical protein MTO96_009858 [Rhipicephalus appendiculatus]
MSMEEKARGVRKQKRKKENALLARSRPPAEFETGAEVPLHSTPEDARVRELKTPSEIPSVPKSFITSRATAPSPPLPGGVRESERALILGSDRTSFIKLTDPHLYYTGRTTNTPKKRARQKG